MIALFFATASKTFRAKRSAGMGFTFSSSSLRVSGEIAR